MIAVASAEPNVVRFASVQARQDRAFLAHCEGLTARFKRFCRSVEIDRHMIRAEYTTREAAVCCAALLMDAKAVLRPAPVSVEGEGRHRRYVVMGVRPKLALQAGGEVA